jgi:hypothetical protein
MLHNKRFAKLLCIALLLSLVSTPVLASTPQYQDTIVIGVANDVTSRLQY